MKKTTELYPLPKGEIKSPLCRKKPMPYSKEDGCGFLLRFPLPFFHRKKVRVYFCNKLFLIKLLERQSIVFLVFAV